MTTVERQDGATRVTFNGFQRGMMRSVHTILYIAVKQLTEEEQDESQTYSAWESLDDLLRADGEEVIIVVEEEL